MPARMFRVIILAEEGHRYDPHGGGACGETLTFSCSTTIILF